MRTDIVPGAMFPDYELSDHTGKHRKLSELQGPHPMVLVLSRGGFCPKNRRQAEGIVQHRREIRENRPGYWKKSGTRRAPCGHFPALSRSRMDGGPRPPVLSRS